MAVMIVGQDPMSKRNAEVFFLAKVKQTAETFFVSFRFRDLLTWNGYHIPRDNRAGVVSGLS